VKKMAPHPSQSVPTQVLYERARKQQLAKAQKGTSGRPGIGVSQRRSWTSDEENALMVGLDMVKGPHWSQILSLFGRNGSIGDPLKDRNQVQLKDKARNLKLFFLKNGVEVPFYLKAVTGDLKTRAPIQAARKEAELKQQTNATEEQQRVDGIMTLASGFPAHHHTDSAEATPSPVRDDSPLHVVEPASQSHSQNPLSTLQAEDEHLRQSLIAASGVGGRGMAAPTASMI
jgi:hypothetical protein